ncbi:MAG: CHAT domain-containing protein [Albidovulum sp.]|uniref:CHAT domain-containing protein n=1 Tax=Albidovulum sp. TaxID=1872424 RepID=UPI00132641D9|nr:CHAT domain-containing tetratricopeptide repeat protein [Defluviimonas sp.]KAB2883579.1 MAG: CHAT domain-containing protein [Defluviimonas sp.]
MADERPAPGAVELLTREGVISRPIALALLLFLSGGAGLHADPTADVKALVERSVDAYRAGATQSAIDLAEQAEALARSMPAAEAEARATAFVHRARLLLLGGDPPEVAAALLDEALRGLTDAGAFPSEPWLGTMGLLAEMDANAGRVDSARARVKEFMQTARPTPWRAPAAATAASIHFRLGKFADAALLLEETLAVDHSVLAAVYGDVFVAWARAQEAAEVEGRIDDAVALIEGRLAILDAFPVDPDKSGRRALLFGKFYLLHEAARYGAAADALRLWAKTGQPTDEELGFIDRMATLTLDYAQLSGAVELRSVQLDYAELAVAFTELVGDTSDPRLGWALRERAAAEKGLDRIATSTQSLRQAAEVLARTEEGRAGLHLVLSDLAANAWVEGKLALSRDLYAQADAAYQAALTAGAPPMATIDRAIESVNRANLAVDLGDGASALRLAAEARALFQQDAAQGEQKWNARAVGARIAAVEARALALTGQWTKAIGTALDAVELARSSYPEGHPDLARALVNAGDLVAATGEAAKGIPLMQEGAELLARALPADTPQVLGAQLKLALVQLTTGDRAAALDVLRRVAESRKAPAYRDTLPEAAFDFETLAWLLLEDRHRGDGQSLDDAFEALQWTQVTRSAEALSQLETRIASADAGLAPFLKRRQDLVEEHRRTTSRVLAAYAGELADPPAVVTMNARLAEIDATLHGIDADLAALGLEVTGIAAVRPLSIAEVQGLLRQGEGLITFALPGLSPSRVPGIDATSNRAILVTRNGVAVGRVAEPSRRALDDRVRAFRCSVAVSDPGCGRHLAADFRGAMIEGGVTDARDYFDLATANRLYLDLFGGVADALDDVEHLIVVPPADLLGLPFAALVTTAEAPPRLGAASWLIRDHALSVLPSVASLRTLRGFPSPGMRGRYLGVGDPVIGSGGPVDCASIAPAALRTASEDHPYLSGPDAADGLRLADPAALRLLPRLPDTACEVESIGRLFSPGQSDILLGPEARETEIKRRSIDGRLSEYDVILFATHGLMTGESGTAAPGLVLTPPEQATPDDDGLLTAAEIATFDLSARLIVLSACNTAAGETQAADGLSGIARAFFHAGAHAVLVTQWSVYSDAALRVSTGLLSDFASSGFAESAQSLRRTQLAILEDPASDVLRQHPSYWAPFTLVGSD